MKRILPFLLLTSVNAGAQDTVVLRHLNGKPALTGPCTFFVNPYFSDEIYRATFYGLRAGAHQRGSFTNHQDNGKGDVSVPDADNSNPKHFGEKPLISLFGLGFSCDGLVTTFYSDGSKQAEISMSRGVPTGAYREYYPDGTVAVQCTLDCGMPTGKWTRYFKSGALYATGVVKSAPKGYLQDAWNVLTIGEDREGWQQKRGWIAHREFADNGLRKVPSEENSALHSILYPFEKLAHSVPLHGVADGKLTFTNRDGSLLADIYFTNGMRTGVWTIWKAPGKVEMRLEYSPAGELTHVTAPDTKRTTVVAYTERWRVQNARDRNQYGTVVSEDPNGVDPDIVVEGPSTSVVEPARREVLSYVEQMPEFNGDIREYLSKNLRYPPKAKDEGIKGRVVVQFVVREDGSLTDAKVIRGIGGGCDEEALRVIRTMPKWKPGKQNGKPVAVLYILPVMFKLG